METPNSSSRHYLGIPKEKFNAAEEAFHTTSAQYVSGGARQFGSQNPTLMDIPFWKHMIYTHSNAWWVREENGYKMRWGNAAFDAERGAVNVPCCPIWCFDRFGQTRIELPDGRVIFIAGEHEDWYDPNFCIYNDVIVLDTKVPFGPDAIKVYGYPTDVFPPTDHHAATYYCEPGTGKEYILVVGGQGYGREGDDPHKDETTVYRLDLSNLMMEKLETTGKKPDHALINHRASSVDISKIKSRTGGFSLQRRPVCMLGLPLLHVKGT